MIQITQLMDLDAWAPWLGCPTMKPKTGMHQRPSAPDQKRTKADHGPNGTSHVNILKMKLYHGDGPAIDFLSLDWPVTNYTTDKIGNDPNTTSVNRLPILEDKVMTAQLQEAFVVLDRDEMRGCSIPRFLLLPACMGLAL